MRSLEHRIWKYLLDLYIFVFITRSVSLNFLFGMQQKFLNFFS